MAKPSTKRSQGSPASRLPKSGDFGSLDLDESQPTSHHQRQEKEPLLLGGRGQGRQNPCRAQMPFGRGQQRRQHQGRHQRIGEGGRGKEDVKGRQGQQQRRQQANPHVAIDLARQGVEQSDSGQAGQQAGQAGGRLCGTDAARR